MSRIAHDFFERSPVMGAPLLAMLIFASVFAVVALRALCARRTDVDRAARLPLQDALEEGGDDVRG